MSAKISTKFTDKNMYSLERALLIADVHLSFIDRILTDLIQMNRTDDINLTQQDYLYLLNEVFWIEVDPWGFRRDGRRHTQFVRASFRQAQRVLDYSRTYFTPIEEDSTLLAQAITPVERPFYITSSNDKKLVIEVNITNFFGNMSRSVDDWRFYAFDDDFYRATILVHEAIHHIFGLVANHESGHFCGAGKNPSKDAYSYQRFMIGHHTPMYRPEGILGPPKEVKCTALNGRNHLIPATGVLNKARVVGPNGMNA